MDKELNDLVNELFGTLHDQKTAEPKNEKGNVVRIVVSYDPDKVNDLDDMTVSGVPKNRMLAHCALLKASADILAQNFGIDKDELFVDLGKVCVRSAARGVMKSIAEGISK